MYDEWQSWLASRGALRAPDGSLRFADASTEIQAAATGDVLADLSAWSLITVRGADAESFLQGQLSNDTKSLAGATRLAAYCTAQGRMLALFRLFAHDGAIILQTPSSIAEAIVKRLRMFVLRAQVTLSLDEDLVAIGISGPRAEALARTLAGVAPSDGECASTQGISVLRVPGPTPRFQFVSRQAEMRGLWERAAMQDLTPVGSAAWRWLDIVSGMPVVWPETTEAFVPQMLNLDALNGINFKKGCYPGQEIVARTHYLGRLKQRTYLAHLAMGEVAPGDPLYARNFGEQAAGTVVDALPSPEGGVDLLAVLQISSRDAGDVRARTPDGPALAFRPLPYALPGV